MTLFEVAHLNASLPFYEQGFILVPQVPGGLRYCMAWLGLPVLRCGRLARDQWGQC
jgi:hypothetical protein